MQLPERYETPAKWPQYAKWFDLTEESWSAADTVYTGCRMLCVSKMVVVYTADGIHWGANSFLRTATVRTLYDSQGGDPPSLARTLSCNHNIIFQVNPLLYTDKLNRHQKKDFGIQQLKVCSLFTYLVLNTRIWEQSRVECYKTKCWINPEVNWSIVISNKVIGDGLEWWL